MSPIVEADLIHRLSGGGTNIDPNAALGDAISTVAGGIIVSDTDNNDMDDITSLEALSGITIYHGYFYSNEITSAVLTWTDPVFWIESQTSSGDTAVAVAIADEAKNLAIEVIATEETAPSGPVFTSPANKAAGIIIGSLDQNDFRGHWIRYIVTPGATAVVDQYTIRAEGDTLP
ncbi:MAG: hypothetical protein O6761_07000 [Thaumarchaeota archaeon]|nr:hypothetical protein [Nitrososphaerota archaeon]